MFKVLAWSFLLVNASEGRSFAVSSVACSNMTPAHGDFEAQSSIGTVQIIPQTIRVNRGQQIKVTLRSVSSNFTFRGYFIQARATKNSEILGNFVGGASSHKIMVCGNSFSTATHSDPSLKSYELLTWKAPSNFRGYLRFQ